MGRARLTQPCLNRHSVSPTADSALSPLQALAHPVRLRAVRLLAERERTAGELAADLELPANLLAYHLGLLREAGLVTCAPGEGDARRRRYALARGVLAELGRVLASLGGAPAEDTSAEAPPAADRLLAAMARTGDGFFVVDSEYRVVLWNAGAEALLGHPARAVLGRCCHEVLAGHSPDGSIVCRHPCRPMQLLAAGAPPACFCLAISTRVGGERWVEMSLLPLPGGLVAHVFHDGGRQGELERFAAQVRQAIASLGGASPPASTPRRPSAALPPLTAREREVLGLLAEGASTATIAARLVITSATARKHVQSLLAKLGAHSRLEAVAVATRAGLLAERPRQK